MTNEREAFEDAIFQPPRTARMIAELGRYASRMDSADREMFTATTMDKFFAMRDKMLTPQDVPKYWAQALNEAAAVRPFWRIWFTWHECGWVKGKEWRGRDCYA